MMPEVEIARWAERVRAGESRALARALSEVENRGPAADGLLRALFPGSRQAWRVGVTGAPGAGKSTLVGALAERWAEAGRAPAVVAIDPNTPFTGGALRGDRVRMPARDGLFVRSMSARGALGGLAPAAADVLTVLAAAGRDPLLIETVGVGQAEVDVMHVAEATALVLTPAAGDDVQALKAGVLEIADVFVINKADLPGAEQLDARLARREHCGFDLFGFDADALAERHAEAFLVDLQGVVDGANGDAQVMQFHGLSSSFLSVCCTKA